MLELTLTTIASIADRPAERRRDHRISFKAASVISEIGSSQVVVGRTSELSHFGCFVQTTKPCPQSTRVRIKLIRDKGIFIASGVVAYASGDGMCVIFSMIDSENYKILATWLTHTSTCSSQSRLGTTAEVREVGSWKEQVLITRDLSAGGCFIRTAFPFPKGSRIRVRIEYAGDEFKTVARVTDNVTPDGMGVEFIEIDPKEKAILAKWLLEKSHTVEETYRSHFAARS